MTLVEREHGFVATQRQYKIKISEWHLDKNIKGIEYEFMASKQAKRALEDKDTDFRVRGRDVAPEKIARAEKRLKLSDEELLAMPSVPTPSDISYDTPSAVDPRSPYVQQMVAQSPVPSIDASANHAPIQSTWNASEWQNQAFLVSPGYLPATPLPVVWHGPSTPLASASFQTPPGMLQSPGAWWNGGPMGGIIEDGEVTAVTDDSDVCKIKYERLIELVRKTEETEIFNYMGAMSEVNSLVYDLITSDQSKSQVIVQEDTALLPECHVCMALKVIGNEDMAAKVESERVLLEAIAVTEGRFGEEHRGAYHFIVKLFLLYENWDCRADSTCSLLLRIMLLTLHNVPTGKAPGLITDLLELPDSAEPVRCAWLQGSSRAQSLDASSHQLSALSIRDNKGRDSPRKVWSILSAITDRVGHIDDESKGELAPFLELILAQGPGSADGSSYFWMVTFISAVSSNWGAICRAKTFIGNAASDHVPGSNAIKSSLEQLLENPYRLEPSAAPGAEREPCSEPSDGASLAKGQSKFDNISLLKAPLENLEELRVVLAEVSLWELERSGNHQAFSNIKIISADDMYDLLYDASRLGNSTLIQKLGKYFQNATFASDTSFSNILKYEGLMADLACEESPLHLAISNGHYRTVDALLNAGADPDGPKGWDPTPLDVAAEHGHDDVVRLLIRRGANWSADSVILSIVFRASDQEVHEKCLETLRSYGDKYSILCSMVFVGQYERYGVLDMVSKLIGELLSTRDKNPSSGKPVVNHNLDPFEREQLHDLLDEDDSGRGLELILDVLTGVHIEQQARGILKTALFGSTDAMDDILDPAEASESPSMHTLVSRNAPNALGVFLELNPDLAALDTQGNTSLHVAAERNRIACAQQLLQSGIDVDVKNNDGETAFEIAVRAGHPDIENLIVSHMGSVDGGEI
ncbi:hypothetical protein BGZ57DRAFT_916718 [Hyaloscypha finlandica]|nr:hypothetical protein BGZ57DRAFT_916718 [Hyaloscypha finlandica]